MNAMNELEVEIKRRGTCHIVKPIGALNKDTVPILRDRIDLVRRRPQPKVILDCRDLSYADMAAGRFFMECKDTLYRFGGVFLMAALSERTQATLRNNGFRHDLGACSSVDKALRLLEVEADKEWEVDVF